MNEKQLNKDTEEVILEKKEPSYREKKANERKYSKFIEGLEKTFFLAQDKITKERQNEMGFSSKVLVTLGKTFNDVSKWKWPKVSKDYQPRITNEEFYAEVHDRILGSEQPSRFKAKYISAKNPEVLKTNIMVSKMRMKLFEFNGYTSAIVSFLVLIGAATLSTGIGYTKTYTAKGYEAVQTAIKTETLTDYYKQVKGYNIEQLKKEALLVSQGSNNSYKMAVLDYFAFKIAKSELETKYPAGTEMPEVEKAKYKNTIESINSKFDFIKQNENQKVFKNEDKNQGAK